MRSAALPSSSVGKTLAGQRCMGYQPRRYSSVKKRSLDSATRWMTLKGVDLTEHLFKVHHEVPSRRSRSHPIGLPDGCSRFKNSSPGIHQMPSIRSLSLPR